MSVISVKHKKIVNLDTVVVEQHHLYATAAMEFVGNTLYYLRTISEVNDEHGKKPVMLGKISDFGNTNKKSSVVITTGKTYDVARHANSITHHKRASETEGHFYITTLNKEYNAGGGSDVLEINTSGMVTKHITYDGEHVYTIAYYDTAEGNLRFIICVHKGVNQYTYKVAKLIDTKLIDDGGSFTVNVPVDFSHGNDICYNLKNKHLFLTVYKQEEDGEINKNYIIEYDLSKIPSNMKTALSPIRVLLDTRTEENKYEIEGVGIFLDNNKKYVCTNTALDNGDTDAVYQLYK